MPVKTNMSAEALAVRIITRAIENDVDVWSACCEVERFFGGRGVQIPFSLKNKACEIADQKLTEMDELETMNEAKKARKKRLKEQTMVGEQNLPDQPRQMADFQAPPQKPVSLDQVVDRYIVRYERESIPLENQPNGPGIAPPQGSQPAGGSPSTLEEGTRPLRSLLEFLLLEQAPPPPPEDEPPAEDPAADAGTTPPGMDDIPDLGGDEGMEDPSGGGGAAPPEGAGGAIVNTPQINLNEFARSIARMVNNYDALLNPKTIILNRVEAYLRSNYNEPTAKHFMQIMERNYGLNITSVEYPDDTNSFPVVYGVGAFAGGAGGGG